MACRNPLHIEIRFGAPVGIRRSSMQAQFWRLIMPLSIPRWSARYTPIARDHEQSPRGLHLGEQANVPNSSVRGIYMTSSHGSKDALATLENIKPGR